MIEKTPQQLALSKARRLHIKKQHAEAAVAYGAALGGPFDIDVYESRGWCYLKSDQVDKAIADFERAAFHYGLAKAYLVLGRTADAVRELKTDLAKGKKASEYSKALLAELEGGAPKATKAGAAGKSTKAAKAPTVALDEPAAVPKRKKGEDYDAFVARLLAAAALGKYARAIDMARVPGLLLVPARGPAAKGTSRIGGLPDLAPGTKWPAHEGSPMLFVMQLRLDELPGTELPAKGLLSFFVCEGLAHDEYLDAGAVLYTSPSACAKLAPATLPKTFVRTEGGKKLRKPFEARALTATAVRKLANPDGPELAAAKVPAEVRARYSQRVFEPAMAAEDGGRHQLLGVRDRSYAGDQPKATTLLLQCVTEPDIGMHWGDDDAICFFAPRAGLAKAEFSRARVVYGD